jgi:hypothetical protein
VVKLEVLFSGGQIDHHHGSAAMSTNTNVPLRGIADSTKRESAPAARDQLQDWVDREAATGNMTLKRLIQWEESKTYLP